MSTELWCEGWSTYLSMNGTLSWGGGVGREIGQLQAGRLGPSACLVLVRDSEESKNPPFELGLQVVMKVHLSK